MKRAQVYDSHETLHNSRVGSNRAALRHLHITRALVKDMALYHLEDPMHTRSPVDWDRVVDNLMIGLLVVPVRCGRTALDLRAIGNMLWSSSR